MQWFPLNVVDEIESGVGDDLADNVPVSIQRDITEYLVVLKKIVNPLDDAFVAV